MRHLLLTRCLPVTAVVLTLGLLGCHSSKKHPITKTAPQEEIVTRLASTIRMGDAKTAGQLLKGFYHIEAGSWRWTKQHFAVILAPPKDRNGRSAILWMKFTVPQAVLDKLGPVTVRAKIGHQEVAPETCRRAGSYTYRREVQIPAGAGEAVAVSFSLDKSLPPGPSDRRELGIIVSSIGLEAR